MYQLRKPEPRLAPFIEHYWFVSQAPGESVDLRVDVFVDGRADLIFNFGVPYQRQVIGGATAEHARSNLDAQRLVPIRILQRGAVRVTGVRFRLGGLGPFVRGSLRVFTNHTPEPSAVFGDESRALEAALAATTDLDRAAQMLDTFFLDRLVADAAYAELASALARLIDTDGRATIESVAADLGISTRQIARAFARYVGIAPKTIARILRFQSTLRALMRDPSGSSLADVAADAGYFDQAHFIKDFKRMSGGVPRGYRGYFPPKGPHDFAPNVVVFLQDRPRSA